MEQNALFKVDGCQLVGVREFAREVGASHTMVGKWIRQGKLNAVEPSGKIRLDEALAECRAQGLGKFREAPPDDNGEPKGELARENIRIARAKADMYEMNKQELLLQLHRTEDIITAFQPMVMNTIARLDAIPAQLAAILPGDKQLIMDSATKLIREVQQELSQMDPEAVVRARRRRGGKIAAAAEETAE